jgi:hypothetical protein
VARGTGGPPRRRAVESGVQRAVEGLLEGLTASEVLSAGQPHLRSAVAALAIAESAERLARAEIIAARDSDGATWEQVGAALGVSRQTAHERFRTGPDGMHSRLFKKSAGQTKSNDSAATGTRLSTTSASRRASSAWS